MTDFEALLACYRSGQVSERQWQGHLKDRAFRAWVEDQLPINYPSACSGRDNPAQEGEVAYLDACEVLWCETCGERPQEVRTEHAGLCHECWISEGRPE